MKAIYIELKRNKYLYLLASPAILFLIIFAYTPMFAYVLAFKKFTLSDGIWGSKWVWFDNFKFFFGGRDWLAVTFNTVFLNSLFVFFGLSFALVLSIFLNEIAILKLKKLFQSMIFLPYFISWLVISFMVFMLLNSSNGILNQLLANMGIHDIQWFQNASYWPAILTIIYIWKTAGYSSVIFLATITGISPDMYESAKIDGASKLQQILYITLPMLRSVYLILVLLGVGRIFYGDFGMIYGIVGDNGLLYATTDVIDTYSYRALRQLGDFSTSSAIVLYQAVMGLLAVTLFNWIAKKVDPDARLF